MILTVRKRLGRHRKALKAKIFDRDLCRSTVLTCRRHEEPVNIRPYDVQVYDEGRLPLYHFDVYRIGDIEEMDEVGFEEYVMGDGVSLIEWANLIEEILPENRTEVIIEKDLEKGFDYRKIIINEMK
ncbi:MAG: tRNA (adenosine(37)-N6)-threonylcarbamoyltransferase complex ATPase subunit type 1 TsaE [[Ruminococcus] torques]